MTAEPGRDRPATMKDVAARAGVSFKSVSNVINSVPTVGPDIKERVETAIRELDYRPSLAGRQLRRGRTGLLGLAVPSVQHVYFARVAHAVIDAAEQLGYQVFVFETRSDRDHEREAARGMAVRVVDGLIFSPVQISFGEIAEVAGATPMVLLGGHYDPVTGVDHVAVDDGRAARQVAEHLLSNGRRRFAVLGVGADETSGTPALRLSGIRQALAEHGVDLDPRLMVPLRQGLTRVAGAEAANRLAPRLDQVDAMICLNDEVAIGAMYTLLGNGVRIPDDIAVAGWDNIEDGRFYRPTLTTVAPDVESLGSLAVGALLDRIADRGTEPQRLVVPHRLLIRGSSSVRD